MLVRIKDELKSVSSLKSYIGEDLDTVIEKMEKTGAYIKFYVRDGINGYRNVTMVRYGVRVEIICEPQENKWRVIDIFAYGVNTEIRGW